MDVREWVEEQDSMFYAEEEGSERGFVTVFCLHYKGDGWERAVDVVAAPIFRTIMDGALKELDGVTRIDTGRLMRRGEAFGYGEAVEAWIESGVVDGYDAPEEPWDRLLRSTGYVEPGMYG